MNLLHVYKHSSQDGTQASSEVMVRTSTGSMVAVNVDELSSALGKEVTTLRSELFLIRNEREQELRTV